MQNGCCRIDRRDIGKTDIEAEMEDIAGIRIMCQFVEDIYNIVNLIKSSL